MMQGPIRRFARHRVDARADARLPTAWIGGATVSPTWTGGLHLTQGVGRLTPNGTTPFLAMLGAGTEEVRAAALAYASAGARVYALVGPEWGKDPADARLLQAPRVLFRRLAEVPATALHAAGEARLWIGGGFTVRLDPGQADALRHTFLRLFWHEATEEAWSGGRPLVWRPAPERPFDIHEVSAEASVRWERADARLSNAPPGGLMHLTAGPPPDAAPRRLWFPAGPEHHDRLARLANAGADVLWTDRGLPDLQVNAASGEALLPGTRGRLRLRLTPGQASELQRLLEEPAAWRFQASARLGEPAHRSARFWLPGEPAARSVEAEQVIKVPDVAASTLRAAPEAAPAAVPAPQPLALTVRYQWTVVPPRVPAGAQEDPLLGRWRELDDGWSTRLKSLREALVTAEEDRRRIERAIPRLRSDMLGFQRTHSAALSRLGAMEAHQPSVAGPSRARELFAELATMEEEARKLRSKQTESERVARELEEREKQEAAWKGRVDAARRDQPFRKTELSAAERDREALAANLRQTEEDLKTADKEARKDLTANQRKLSDELARRTKDIARLRGEITALEQQAAEPFVPQAAPATIARPPQGAGRFVPTAAPSVAAAPVPDDALPDQGDLRTLKGQRYLVLQTWEQLAAAEPSAARLSARLVAPENA
jgi:hypothetical protein